MAEVQADLPLVWDDSEVLRGPVAGSAGTVWTVGHSTHPLEEFVEIVSAHGVTAVADVRRFAGSRRYPHFNPGPLAEGLRAAGIGYEPFPELGGRRTPAPDSPHAAWRNTAFRGYADYMDTAGFRAAMDRLGALAGRERVAVMCSEGVWWRCHRAMIADDMKANGWTVLHVMGAGEAKEHPYTPVAKIVGGKLTY